ncbi:MAG: DUF1080 domain-containing protein [Planctomycetota bacterium]|nr:DUF1080 domain-containing protein [Planctomycetaceae bacterium]MDQ3331030.1 DUF1080 domain-containing protein [Planctomycetota bacterium]
MTSVRVLILAMLVVIGCSSESGSPPAGTTSGTAMAESSPDVDGFMPIDANDLVLFHPPTEKGSLNVSQDGDSILLQGDARGYLHSKKPYRDFTLRLDVRWPNTAELPEDERANANTGMLVFITGADKIWPKCLEVQGKWSELGHIKSNAKDVTVEVRDDQAARERARKPVGEWNSLEIVAKDGALTSILNGVKIAESDPTELREGRIGFQAERFDVEFRNVRIREE